MNIPSIKAKVMETMGDVSTRRQPHASENSESDGCRLTFRENDVTAVFDFSSRVGRLSRAFREVPIVDLNVTIEGEPESIRKLVEDFKNSFELKLLRGGG